MKILKTAIFLILCVCITSFVQSNTAFSYTNTIPNTNCMSLEKSFNFHELDNNAHSIYITNTNQEISTAVQRKRVDLLHHNNCYLNSKITEFKYSIKLNNYYKLISYHPKKFFLTEISINAP